MKTWHWLVVVIGLFICGLFLGHLFLGKYWIVSKYDVFKDVLSIVLVISGLGIALLGAAMYVWISSALDKRVEKKVNEQVNVASAKFYMELSYIYWGAYEVDGKFVKVKKSDLGLAVEQSENALKKVNLLDEKKFESHVCVAKNNLAYHLAVRKYADDAERAISLAKYAYDRVWKYDYKDTYRYVETYAFVLIRLGDQEQKKDGVNILKKTLKRGDLPDSAKKCIRQKYSGKGLSLGPSWN